VVEEYNGITTKLNADLAQQRRLSAALGPAQLQSVLAQQRVATIIHNIVLAGPGSNSGFAVLLSGGSTTDLVNELGTLSAIARAQRATLTTASALVGKYRSQKATLDKLVAQEAAQKASLAAKKRTIQEQISRLVALEGGSAVVNRANLAKDSKAYTTPVACPQVTPTNSKRLAAVKKACSLLYPIHWYGWGDAGPSKYDCSGLTMTAWAAAGVSLAHFTGDQWKESHSVGRGGLQPGDLVFYNSGHHVAIYIGNGWIVQAEHTGEPIKESPLTFDTVVSSGYRAVNGF
jgi:cell wall-associated NlpC family hydrolase